MKRKMLKSLTSGKSKSGRNKQIVIVTDIKNDQTKRKRSMASVP